MNKIQPINLSPSFLSNLLKHGYDYAVAQKLGLIERLPTTAMQDGKLIHALISERLGVKTDEWVVSPYDSFRTKEAKEWRDSQPDNVLIVKQETIDKFNGIAERVVNHPQIKPLLENVKPELIVEKQVNGFNVKGILDVLSNYKGKTVIDWKFVSGKNFDNFSKEALYSHYDLQASVYDFLVDATHVYFGAIESEAPHRIKLFYCDPSFLESGADKFNEALSKLKEAQWRQPNFDIEAIGDLKAWGY